MSKEDAGESLQASEPFDIHSVIARAMASESEDEDEEPEAEVLDDGEAGPADPEGAPTDEADDATADEEADEAPEDEEATPEAEKPAEPEEKPAPADPNDERLKRLESLVQQSQQAQNLLLDILAKQQAPVPAQPQRTQDDVSQEALRIALFGNTAPDGEERWKALDPRERARAVKFAQNYADAETKFALDPKARYREQLRQLVLEDVYQVVGPLLQERHNAEAKALFEAHAKGMEQTDVERMSALFYADSRSRAGSFQDQKLAFEAAAAQAKYEKQARELTSKSRDVQAVQRQEAANKAAARKKQTRGTKGRGGPNPRPKYTPGTNMLEYMKKLQEEE